MKKKIPLFFLVMVLVLSAVICFNVNPVSAQVVEMSIDLIEYYWSGTDLILNITVTHDPQGDGEYLPLNFIDHLELEIDGAYPYISVDTTQFEVTHFSVQYNMGEVTNTPSIRVRAARLQGEGEWFGPIVIPEFSLIHLAPILAALSIAILLMKSKITTNKQCNR